MRVPKYIVLDKKRGETPLEALSAWKSTHSEFAEVPASYAGRLDPMAEGKLLVLLGEECKKQALYTKLDKEYEVEVLLGARTDTGDVLGFVDDPIQSQVPFNAAIVAALKKEVGSHSRKYPVFSSKTVRGKPLFLYALEGKLDTITIPEHIEKMYSISLKGVRTVSTMELQKIITEHLSTVPRSDEPSKALGNDFRQDEVRERWAAFFATTPQEEFTIIKIRGLCSSGSYMRTLAERIGSSLGNPSLALSIKRAKIGKYWQLFGGAGFWIKTYR